MFGLGAMEIGLILVVALFVIGPQKLPEVAGQIARTIRDLQRTATDFSREITNPVNDLKRGISNPVNELKRDIARPSPKPSAPDPYADIAAGNDALEDVDDEGDDEGGYGEIAAEEEAFELEMANRAPEPSDEAADVDESMNTEPAESTDAPAPALPEIRPAPHSVAFGGANWAADDASDEPAATADESATGPKVES